MENTTGPIKVFLAGKLPKKKYTDIDEFAADLAAILAIDEDRIVIDLINLPDIKGEKGDKGDVGKTGPKGDDGADGVSLLWEGAWLTATAYNQYNVVENDGSLWMAIANHVSAGANEPGVGVDTATYWVEILAPNMVSVTAFATLTDAAPVVWAATANGVHNNATVTITTNRTLSLTGWTNGMHGTLKIVQGGAGSNTITLPAGSLTPGGSGITLSTGVGDIDVLNVFYDGTNYFWTVELDFA